MPGARSEALSARLAAATATLGLVLEARAIERLVELSELVETWGQRSNLSAHRTAEAVLDRLVLDALALGMQLPAVRSLVDLGAGAGFPGLPLAIVRPETHFTLVESRERRHHFQREALRQLGLANVSALLGRAEQLDPTPHELGIAQAMGPAAEVAPLLLRWLEAGGLAVIPGSARPPDPGPVEGAECPEIRSYLVPPGGVARTLWLARRAPA